MLDRLNAVPPDPILGIIAAHAADDNPNKIDLGIGVYKDEAGETPILDRGGSAGMPVRSK